MKTRTLKQDKVNVITLGCSKNLVDSENLITQLKANDFDVVHDSEEQDANIVIVNTCGFIDVAKQESIDTILEYANVRSEGGIDKLYVTGCLSQRYREDLEREIPEVDAWFGTLELPGLLARFNVNYQHDLIGERLITTPPHYAYLKISEGCNRTCSFCAIPLMRGKHVSRSIESLVAEAKSLAKRGVKELMLIAQELTYYGLDLYKKRELPALLDALCEVEGIEWIRLHYAYPSKFPAEIFDAMTRQPKVCNYLDIPLQHAANGVLERMRRQITREETTELIELARQKVPDIAIRTTMLVGFPGETEAEFQELCDFVREMEFERLGVFQYSHEENTTAFDLPDDVPEEVKADRASRLMEIQQEISYQKNLEKVNHTYRVLFDRKEGAYFVGRTESDSPEVDNEVLVEAKSNFARIGDFANVKVTSAAEFDLFGTIE
ncbi:MAG: 30S ribosomal protein S12 methylthiotransferase RimO [Saprospiraceae bacterium]|nr:30S ribosomal protein S12 methylthiotransferase RimO [Saprospiraceae bacterium]MCF8251393.1 30S ribosomal protein S12 methylthiotransferase RimO [Saprospiraceae bacterium]MCF8282640.1 30S ribosomal protein S12 methylthiotransferase RimO [Bacteroidales bacterium]MCF8312667.1 30S ribosomal protein S12 methylthiotransferase RimO [Saprospiraceae bacterium]MCF8441067.1 30S ribosomal protein S12 methylthiotransferase RimO [Saprospiraceae bacterium]